MKFDKTTTVISLAIAAGSAVGGWLLSDMWKRGAESEKMIQLEMQTNRIPELESQRQREKDRADRLDLEVISLRQRIDDMTKAHSTESARLHESLLSIQKELSAANLKVSAQQKCAYLDELTKNSKNSLDSQISVGIVSSSDVYARQAAERRQQLLNEFEKNRAALVECLTG